MFRSYLKIAFRNLWKNRLFSTLNVVGMGVGIAAVGLMVLYVWHELSYDRFNANADRIFRVVHYAQWAGGNLQLAPTSAPFAGALTNDYPEIEKAVRLYPEGGGMITYRDKKSKPTMSCSLINRCSMSLRFPFCTAIRLRRWLSPNAL